MTRRKETRTVTRVVETRIEFTASELRRLLCLPVDAELFGRIVIDNPDSSIILARYKTTTVVDSAGNTLKDCTVAKTEGHDGNEG